jgi:hypothetical protein
VPGVSVRGRLFVNGAPLVRQPTIALVRQDSAFPSPAAVFTPADGQFVISGIAPGKYSLEITNLPADAYMKAARFGAAELTDFIEITKQTASTLQIQLAQDGGRVAVSVYDSQGGPAYGAEVVLVPDASRRQRGDQYRVASADENGHITIRGVPPGDYTAFAWEDPEPNAYRNSEYLHSFEGMGSPIHIDSGASSEIAIRAMGSP